MNRREMMFTWLQEKQSSAIPAAFFLHFTPEHHVGDAAISKHLEFFNYTGMDILKIQYERTFPFLDSIQQPGDWAQMPHYGLDFYEEQLKVVGGLVKAAKHEAVVIATLYSPFMCAASTVGAEILVEHLRRDPEQVAGGLEAITNSLLLFVRECIKLGVDGFYHSTQGGEAHRLGSTLFEQYVKPYDLTLMNEINQNCDFNILHVCDYAAPYDDFSPFMDYPGDVVSCPFKLGEKELNAQELATLFKRPIMGGMERKGTIATGTPEAIRREVERLLPDVPAQFMLGADCTVPNETPWDNLRVAIETAHTFGRD